MEAGHGRRSGDGTSGGSSLCFETGSATLLPFVWIGRESSMSRHAMCLLWSLAALLVVLIISNDGAGRHSTPSSQTAQVRVGHGVTSHLVAAREEAGLAAG